MIFTINTTCCMNHRHGAYTDDDLKNTTTSTNHTTNMTHCNTNNTNDVHNNHNSSSDQFTIMNDVWDHIILPTVPIICDIYVETDNNAKTKSIRIPDNNNKSNSSSNDNDYNYQQQQQQECTKLVHENIHVQYKQLLLPCSSTSSNNDLMQSQATRTNTIHFPSLLLLLRPNEQRNTIRSGRISWSNCHLQPFSIQNILDWSDSNNYNNNYMLERKQYQNKQQYIGLPIIPTPDSHIVWQHVQQQSIEMENSNTNSTNGKNQIVVHLQQSLFMDTSYAKRIFTKFWKKHIRVIFLNTTTVIEHNDSSTTLSINGTPVHTMNVNDHENENLHDHNFVPATNNNDVNYVTSKFDFDSLFMNVTVAMSTAVPKSKVENKEISLHVDDTIDIDATDHVVQQNTTINDTTNIIPNTSHQHLSFISEGRIYDAPQQRNSHVLVQEQEQQQQQRPKNNINHHHNHHRIIFEQMMEKEMNDIHTILVGMCLTAIAIVVFLGYSIHKQQQQSLAITTNLRSTKSNSHNHDNNRSGGSRYRYSNSNNRAICPNPPYSNRKQIYFGDSDYQYHHQQQPNYEFVITTSTQHDLTISPLSLDPIFMHQQQHQQDHNHDDDSTIPLSDKMDAGTNPNNDRGTPTLSRSQSFLPNPPPAIKSTVVPLLSSTTERCLNRINTPTRYSGDNVNQDRPNRSYIHHLQEENLAKQRQDVSTDSRNPSYHEIELSPTNVKTEAQVLNKQNSNKADVFESIQITEPESQPLDKHECCEKFLFEQQQQIGTNKVLTSTNDTVSPISNNTKVIVTHDSQQETDLITMKPVAVVTPEAQRMTSNSTDDLLINGSCSFMDDYWKAT